MPIKLKKTNILRDVDNPPTGYIILGFDEQGTLVTKDSDGIYKPVIPIGQPGIFQDLIIDNLTIGNRLISEVIGTNSITQGEDSSNNGTTSFVSGENNDNIVGNYSYSRGKYISNKGNHNFINGTGNGINAEYLTANGNNNFINCYSTTTSIGTSSSNNCVLLGGLNNKFSSTSNNSSIIGGSSNTVISTNINTTLIALPGITTGSASTTSNLTYIPRLTLMNDTSEPNPVIGTIAWNGKNFIGRKLGNGVPVWTNLDDTISTVVNQNGVKVIEIQGIFNIKNFILKYPVTAYLQFILGSSSTGSCSFSVEQDGSRTVTNFTNVSGISYNLLLGVGKYRLTVSGNPSASIARLYITGVFGTNTIDESLIE